MGCTGLNVLLRKLNQIFFFGGFRYHLRAHPVQGVVSFPQRCCGTLHAGKDTRLVTDVGTYGQSTHFSCAMVASKYFYAFTCLSLATFSRCMLRKSEFLRVFEI